MVVYRQSCSQGLGLDQSSDSERDSRSYRLNLWMVLVRRVSWILISEDRCNYVILCYYGLFNCAGAFLVVFTILLLTDIYCRLIYTVLTGREVHESKPLGGLLQDSYLEEFVS